MDDTIGYGYNEYDVLSLPGRAAQKTRHPGNKLFYDECISRYDEYKHATREEKRNIRKQVFDKITIDHGGNFLTSNGNIMDEAAALTKIYNRFCTIKRQQQCITDLQNATAPIALPKDNCKQLEDEYCQMEDHSPKRQVDPAAAAKVKELHAKFRYIQHESFCTQGESVRQAESFAVPDASVRQEEPSIPSSADKSEGRNDDETNFASLNQERCAPPDDLERHEEPRVAPPGTHLSSQKGLKPDQDEVLIMERLREKSVVRYGPGFRQERRDTPEDIAARESTFSEFAKLVETLIEEGLAVNPFSEYYDYCNVWNNEDFSLARELHTVAYLRKSPNGRMKIGATSNSKKRINHPSNSKEDEYHALLDFDKLCTEEDVFVKGKCEELARLLTFDPQNIPKKLGDTKALMTQKGVHFVLQFLFHSIGYDRDASPNLSGVGHVQSCGECLFARVIESGYQHKFREHLIQATSKHELKDHDMEALIGGNERAYKKYRAMQRAVLKRCKSKEQPKAIAAKGRTYMGNWKPAKSHKWTAATPLIAVFMMGLGHLYGQDDEFDVADLIINAFARESNPQDPYNTSCFDDDDKDAALENIDLYLGSIEENGGIHAIDTNELAYESPNHDSSLHQDLTNRNWELIGDYQDLKLYVFFDENGELKTILGVIRPLCYMIQSAPGFSADKNRAGMTDRAVCAEAFRLLIQSFLNDCEDPPQDEFFKGNIVIAHSVSMYFVVGLRASPKTGSLLFKNFLTPIEFNLFERKYHNLSIKMDAWSSRSQQGIDRVDRDRSTTRDRFIYRRAVHIILKATDDTSLSLAMERVLDLFHEGQDAKSYSIRCKTFREGGYICGPVLDAFNRAWVGRKSNKGNQTIDRKPLDHDLDDFMKWIEQEVEQHGKCLFWIDYYDVRHDITGMQESHFEVGQEVRWKTKKGFEPVLFQTGSDKKGVPVPFRSQYRVCPKHFDAVYERFRKEKDQTTRHENSVKLHGYKFGNCHYGKGPFNARQVTDEFGNILGRGFGKGWALMKVTKKS